MPFTVRKHIAPMTGACWFIVVDEYDARADDLPYFDDFDDAQLAADELNESEAE